MEELIEKFKTETGFDACIDNDLRGRIYTDYYVEWLEEQLMQKRKDQLLDFAEWLYGGMDKEVEESIIDDYLEDN